MKNVYVAMIIFACLSSCSQPLKTDYPVTPVPFTKVQFTDTFWLPRLEINRVVTIPYDFKKCAETGRIDNFAKAGGLMAGAFRGIRFDDSDVFKIIEGAAYSFSMHPDTALDQYLDDLIAKIAAAQEDDGYLYTTRTIDPQHPARDAGPERWSQLKDSHELYNVGHMYEAAVAHYQATGKRTFLDIALKNADLIDSEFGPGKRYDVPGHEEIEIGLVKLYRITGNEKYLKLAKFFLDRRGRPENRQELYGDYAQDHIPVIEQDHPVGHAVRAGYLYSGMADVAALTGDSAYVSALNKIWENVVYKKLYLTGGIGARHSGEAFGEDYELPNLTAYNETCAAIANMLWNYRMFLLHGDSKYIDVLERTLYNGFLSGISLTGNEFFYPNPLESEGKYQRSPWFDCSCCPSNVVRFLPSLPGYVYAVKKDQIYINLYIQNRGEIKVGKNLITLTQETRYPWDGVIRITIDPKTRATFGLRLRIPGWAENRPVPGDLYLYKNNNADKVIITMNGAALSYTSENGYAIINRTWQQGDFVDIHLPMPVQQVLCNDKVVENHNKLAFERGPLVYCAEGIDNNGHVLNMFVPGNENGVTEFRSQLLNGVTVINLSAGTTIKNTKQPITLIPYYAWAHRGQGEMRVWFPVLQK
ncbi:MAG TPA: glycoside hydrolase family 127 protein [bacterium]|nr:glycoside hydrolase family 127 protein [bacterium]HPN44087.1 glycoside hydrolase family 127 protein [bacterium]